MNETALFLFMKQDVGCRLQFSFLDYLMVCSGDSGGKEEVGVGGGWDVFI